MRERWPRLFAAGVIVSWLFASGVLHAQADLGHIDDANTVPRGLLRLRAITAWTRYDTRFAASGVEPLGAPFIATALGAAQMPALTATEALVQSVTESPFSLSLGRSTLNAVAREVILPLSLEYGVSNRFSIGVVVPIVQKRGTMLFVLDSTGANVGPNPGRTSSAAEQNNSQVQAEFANAIEALEARLTFCRANPASPGCAALLAREGEAQTLILDAQQFAAELADLFGGGSQEGMPFVPRTQSAAQTAIGVRVADFNARFRDLLSVDLIQAVPSGAGGAPGSADFQSFLTAEGRDSLTTQERLGIGDVEVGFKLRLLDMPVSETRSAGVMLSLASSARLPTGSRQSPNELVDLRLGAGTVVIDSRAILDARGGRFGILAAGHFATSVTEDTTASAAARSRRSTELHVAPRVHLSEPLSIHGAYSMRSTDKLGGDQLVGGGVTFSTLSAFRAGSKSIPMEMRFTHLEAITGDAGRPKFFRDQLEVRIYYRLRR
jgi:hypothetical protein